MTSAEHFRIEDIALGGTPIPPRKLRRSKNFIMVPMEWFDRLSGSTGATHRLAIWLLHLHWRNRSKPVKLGNIALKAAGVSRQSKWRALRELERRKLITVEQRSRRSPIVRLLGV